jgi:hypothetical protein
MNYAKPEIILCTSALTAIQSLGKVNPIQHEVADPNRRLTIPAYEADE